ncbi:hypothetical protein AAP_05539 [Ascosphaera apis ARSEF 7405]|uniref:Uncharacterized protein n=1 Tax=Ascosphaera apis ARSEF 7405 TaxID=392613 RepID=A0A167VJP6_9EURO|nr:hypothetical protein AAP_05539 [Ascosphaera apis ARSEF 7405]
MTPLARKEQGYIEFANGGLEKGVRTNALDRFEAPSEKAPTDLCAARPRQVCVCCLLHEYTAFLEFQGVQTRAQFTRGQCLGNNTLPAGSCLWRLFSATTRLYLQAKRPKGHNTLRRRG